MSRILKTYKNKAKIEFNHGCFDEWCVFLTKTNGKRYAPSDTKYFSRFKVLGEIYGPQKIYDDFVVIYNRTTKAVNHDVFELIAALSKSYKEDALEIEVWLGVIYAGMIAEENKDKAILKKRIKRLGMHQLLLQGYSADKAANFSKGKKWRELDVLMVEFGF